MRESKSSGKVGTEEIFDTGGAAADTQCGDSECVDV